MNASRRIDRHEAARRRAEQEQRVGIDPNDAAGRWLAAHDPQARVGTRSTRRSRRSL